MDQTSDIAAQPSVPGTGTRADIPKPDLECRLGNDPIKILSKPPPSERIDAQAGDFPGDEHNDGEDGNAPAYAGSLTPYHGTKGFVPVGRAVFASAIFQNRDHKQFFWLMDLYATACFRSEKPYAPGTRVPVPIIPGQVMTSWNILRNRWGQKSDRPVRTFLEKAEEAGLITQERVLADGTRVPVKGGTSAYTQKALCTVITLCHYILYKKGDKHDVGNSA